jgi:hypothetical protein
MLSVKKWFKKNQVNASLRQHEVFRLNNIQDHTCSLRRMKDGWAVMLRPSTSVLLYSVLFGKNRGKGRQTDK